MERITHFSPAFDGRADDPAKNYGVHGMDAIFVLKGELGAISFTLFTNWHTKVVSEEHMAKLSSGGLNDTMIQYMTMPMAADISYHATKPQYEGQTFRCDCPWLDGRPCYSDGSSLQALKYWETLLEKGSGDLWEMLEEHYIREFGELA